MDREGAMIAAFRGGALTYVQRLPALNLSIEQGTDDVPADNFFYLQRGGETLGRYRSLKQAQAAWDAELAASGWSPPPRNQLSSEEMMARDKAAKDALKRRSTGTESEVDAKGGGPHLRGGDASLDDRLAGDRVPRRAPARLGLVEREGGQGPSLLRDRRAAA